MELIVIFVLPNRDQFKYGSFASLLRITIFYILYIYFLWNVAQVLRKYYLKFLKHVEI